MRFVGTKTLAECSDYINLCDLVVDPTLRTDGYDMTIAEAMAYAKPVIVSDVGANSTLIDATMMRDDILIPRGDHAALLRETHRLLRILGCRSRWANWRVRKLWRGSASLRWSKERSESMRKFGDLYER